MSRVPTPPQHHPSPTELDDLELIVTGAAAPVTGFNEPGSPLTLDLPAELRGAESVELVDPEGLPLARVHRAARPSSRSPTRSTARSAASTSRRPRSASGTPAAPSCPSSTRSPTPSSTTCAGAGRWCCWRSPAPAPPSSPPSALVRATLVAAATLEAADVVVVPLARARRRRRGPRPRRPGGRRRTPPATRCTGWWRAATCPTSWPRSSSATGRRPRTQGLVLFFTGLSGSGKSTLARALMDRLLERGGRSVTSLDGDVVRRHLSAGLTFSKEDRETNIRRIGWVAAEIARHGGVAVCSPIAPFDETRRQVRAMVEEAGGAFFLVHVATPLEECERRDRKGLYAKARRGEIPEFTGISSPYEEPEDAAVRVDTTGRSIEDALDDVLVALRDEPATSTWHLVVEQAAARS